MTGEESAKQVINLDRLRVVDLSKVLDPATERRRCALRRHSQALSGVDRSHFYSEIDIMSHLGTHLEFPYHIKDEWKDGSKLPISAFVGRGILMNLQTARPNQPVRRSDLDEADHGRVRPGDTVLLNSPFHNEPFFSSPDDHRPDLSEVAALWFLEKRVKCVGWGDGIAIENHAASSVTFHDIMLGNDILIIEVVKNLDHLREDIFMIVYAPLPIIGLDSCPVRVMAIEGLSFAD